MIWLQWTLAYFEFVRTQIMPTEHIFERVWDALILWMCIGAGSVYWLGISKTKTETLGYLLKCP